MKKLLILLFSLLISFNSYGEAWKQVAVSESDLSIIYIDTSTIKIDKGYVYYWALRDLKTSEYGDMSMKFYSQGDCSNYRINLLSSIYYLKPMGINESSSTNDAGGWEDVNTYSLFGSLLSYACDSKKKMIKGLEAYNNGDYATALSEWENLAYQGDTDAQYQVGEMFFIGLGVEKNNETAIYWHTLAANQKNIESESRLGDIYISDTLKDYDKAAFWYKRAANHGHLNAHFNLGILYETGAGVQKNHILGYMHSVISQKDNGEYHKKFMTNQELTTAKKLVKECKAKRTNKCYSVIINWEKAEQKKKDIEERNKTINFARENSKNNPGFRDLKPGMPLEDYYKNCVDIYLPQNKCYGIQNIKFSKDTKRIDGVEIITILYLDMGPFSGEEADSNNLYRDMAEKLNAKYDYEYGFSERDREIFNAKQKKELLQVYSNGQVVLKISRKTGENTFLEKLWLDIEYRDVKSGKLFLKRNRPVAANLNDF